MPTQVIDISANNHHPLDFVKIRNSGRSAVIVKLTEGDSYVNPYALTDIRNAKAAGMIVAGYHYVHPTLSIASQMQLIEEHLDAVKFVWVDSEVAAKNDAEVTHAMLDALAAKVKTGLYGSYSFIKNMPGAPWGDRVWLAEYGPRPSMPYTLWQFSPTGRVPGIQGNVDLSYFGGSIPQLAALLG